jgi:hypothetical protein
MSPEAVGAERDSSGAGYAHREDTPGAEGESVNSVPESVREAARRAFDARPKGVVVADLMFDSLLDGDRRASADPSRRNLRFGDGQGGADVTVTEAGVLMHVHVRVLPAQKCDIEVRSKGPVMTVRTSDAGTVEFELPAGLMSLVIWPVRTPQARPLQTAWVRI